MIKHDYISNISNKNCTLIVLVSYYSCGWIQSCITMLNRHIINVPVLVIDNNPSFDDSELRKKSFVSYPYNSHGIQVQNNNHDSFEKERTWIAKRKNITAIMTPYRLWHGEAINLALKYARAKYFHTIVLVEPDCVIKGSKWYNNLVEAITSGFKMASGCLLPDGSLHPCPSAWSVNDSYTYEFKHMPKASDYFEAIYPSLVDVNNTYDFEMINWDTSKKAWYEFAKKEQAKFVECPDFVHLWARSSSQYFLPFYL